MSERSDQPVNKCPLGCRTCGRSCRAAQAQNHRFDCCGEIVAHVHFKDKHGYGWHRAGIAQGYLTGLTQTKRPAWAP